jgi:uncharacterized membrane protein
VLSPPGQIHSSSYLGEAIMAKFFGNLWAVVAVGSLLALGLWFMHMGGTNTIAGFVTFLHVLVGIMWIGHLYYFNFTQIPTMPKITPVEHKAAVTKFIAPEALFWFRWAALATVITGLIVAHLNGYLHEALTLKQGFRGIGLGMWLALIMAFNVWFIIWPNQKKALGIVPAEDAVKAKAAVTAMMFSRTNTLLSIPMLLGMVMHRLGGAY